MFDTMTATKVVAGFCGALLVFVVANRVAGSIYGFKEVAHHGEHELVQGYHVEVASEDTEMSGEPAEEGPAFEELYASADAAAGEGLWRNCRSCHALEAGKNGTGPYLVGVVDRAIGSVEGFNYSGALNQVGDVWSPENLNTFLTNPKGAAPGTTMSFRGLPDAEDRANLIAFLATQN